MPVIPEADEGCGPIEIFGNPAWQMSFGERAALEGVLNQCKPKLAFEVGIAQGGSLERIAHHSDEVHAFDLTEELAGALPPNVTFHRGDSREQLPIALAELECRDRQVDFALVDGDHSAVGVRADLEALLGSAAVTRTVILAHDSFNPFVRAGIAALDPANHPKVTGYELDFIPGRMISSGEAAGQLWNGFALLMVGPAARLPQIVIERNRTDRDTLEFHDAYETLGRGSRLLAEAFGNASSRAGA